MLHARLHFRGLVLPIRPKTWWVCISPPQLTKDLRGPAPTNRSEKTAMQWYSFIFQDRWSRRCNMGVKTDSGALQPGVAVGAAMLTLQVLSIRACLLAPRDCNCIRRVILHRSDTQWRLYGKPCPQHAHKTQNGQSKRRQSQLWVFPQVKTEAKRKKMRLRFSFKRAIWCICLLVD